MPFLGLGFLELEPQHLILLSASICLAFIAVAIFHPSQRDSRLHSHSGSAKSTIDPNKERGNGSE